LGLIKIYRVAIFLRHCSAERERERARARETGIGDIVGGGVRGLMAFVLRGLETSRQNTPG